MAIGDVVNPKRPRLQANERLDTVDVDALSSTARGHLDAYARAVEVVPRNVGSTTPTGFVFQGFGLTLNPINPTDAKVRVQSALGVAMDSNGRTLIKESGTTVDLTLSAGNSQIYAYFSETGSDTAIRRAISVTSPYPESGQSIATELSGGVAFFVRAGDATSIVASDTVAGATTPLCFLGVANNSGGTVTMVGYNSTTAPNGSAAVNRLTTVVAPTTLPTVNTYNGSVATMHGLVNAALYMVGQAMWKGSNDFVPSASNNFGAFTLPPSGLATNLRAGTVTYSSSVGSVANTSTRPDFGGDDGAVPSPLWAYCVHPGAAFLRNGSTNSKVQIAPGELMQSDGSHPEMLRYRFLGADEFTLTSGDATNPRCDLLQIKITFDPSAGPQVTLSTKTGTAAVSPVIPDPDAGFVPVGIALVGATWAAASAPIIGEVASPFTARVHVYDVRMPLGVRSYVALPAQYMLDTAWALAGQNQYVTASSGTNSFIARCPTTIGRLVGVDGPAPLTLTSCSLGLYTPDFTVTNTPVASSTLLNGFGSYVNPDTVVPRSRRLDFEQLHVAFGGGPTIQASAVNKIGVPLWTNGFRAPQIPLGEFPAFAVLIVKNLANATKYGNTTFYVAQGL